MTALPTAPSPEENPEVTTDPGLLRLLLWGSVLLITFGAFENLAVTTILPVVARDLDGFALYALAAGLPLAAHVAAAALGGVLVDAYSFQRPLVAGTLISAIGLTIAGLAPEMWILAIGRGIAGFGVGFVTVALYAAVGIAVPTNRRPGFFAAFSAAWVVPSMVGPAIAGILADAGLWRWVFLGVAIPSLASLLLLKPLLTHPSRGKRTPGTMRRAFRRVVLPATGLAVALAVLQGVTAEGTGGLVPALVSLVVVLALMPLLMPRGTFTFRFGVPSAVASRLLINGAVIGMEAFLPLFLQEGRGWTPTASGLVLTAGAVTWAAGSAAQARVVKERSRQRFMIIGSVLVAVGLGAVTTILIPDVPAFIAPIVWLLAGFGMGVAFPSLSVFALDNTPVAAQGEVSAALQIADGVGAGLSIALFGLALTTIGHGDAGFAVGFFVTLAFAILAVVSTARVRKVTGPSPHVGPSSQ